MTTHIETARLKKAAERKIVLEAHEWKHIEECRACLEHLRDAIRTDSSANARSAAYRSAA
jgi:hypothetical protein